MPSSSICFLALILFALSHANTSAAIMTPTTTAKAKLCRNTVTKVTITITKISDFGILLNEPKLAHSKVPMATMIIKPVRAAMGTFSMKLEPNIINTSNITEATIPESRARAPLETLIKLWPIMAQPPIPENIPESILAAP